MLYSFYDIAFWWGSRCENIFLRLMLVLEMREVDSPLLVASILDRPMILSIDISSLFAYDFLNDTSLFSSLLSLPIARLVLGCCCSYLAASNFNWMEGFLCCALRDLPLFFLKMFWVLLLRRL